MQPEKEKTLEQAAGILAADHSDTAEALLLAAMREVALHNRYAGVGAKAEWLKALQSLGEICISIVKRER